MNNEQLEILKSQKIDTAPGLVVQIENTFYSGTEEELISQGISQSKINEAKLKTKSYTRRTDIRSKIRSQVGDDGSLLGYTSDGASIALYSLAYLINAINTSQNIDEIKQKISFLTPFATNFISAIENNHQKLPFQVKGYEEVVNEILEKLNEVSSIIEQN